MNLKTAWLTNGPKSARTKTYRKHSYHVEQFNRKPGIQNTTNTLRCTKTVFINNCLEGKRNKQHCWYLEPIGNILHGESVLHLVNNGVTASNDKSKFD